MQKLILTLIIMNSVAQIKATEFKSNIGENQLHGGPVVTVGPATDVTCDFNSINAAILSGSAEVRISNEVVFNENIDISNRNISLIGGYLDCDGAFIDDRTYELTTISGDQTVPVVSIDNNTNFFNVYLENLHLTNGKELSGRPGGGLYISGNNTYVYVEHMWSNVNFGSGVGVSNNTSAEVYLSDVWLANNQAQDGGGIHCLDSNVSVYGASAIYSNHAIGTGANVTDEGKGGGVYAGSGCSFNYYSGPNQPQLGANGIIWNQANYHGGGIYVENGGDVYLYGQPQSFRGSLPNSFGNYPVNISHNVADEDNNHSATDGGGLYATGLNTNILFQGVSVIGNQAPGSGGGVALFDQANFEMFHDSMKPCWNISKCNSFKDNKAFSGGAIFADTGSTMYLRNGWIEDNSADFGSALYLNGANSTGFVDGVLIADNDYNPGANEVNTVIHVLNGAELMMLFSTIANHEDAINSVITVFFAAVEMYGNLVFQSGSTPISGNFNGTITAECMYVYDNTGLSGPNIQTTDVDPFVDRSHEDFHLIENSLALDACASHPQSSSVDMDNQLRGWDDPIPDLLGLYDIGADESYLSDVIFKNNFE